MDNRLLILVIILSVFYFLFVYNKKIVENFGAIPLDNLNNLAAQFISDNNTKLTLPFNNVDMNKSTINIGSELKIGSITLKVVNNELVIDKPIKSTSAKIGKWDIRKNRMGIKDATDMLNIDNSINFVDYDKEDVNSKICINNIETKEISPTTGTKSIFIDTPRLATVYDTATKLYRKLNVNDKELLYRGLISSPTIVGLDKWQNSQGPRAFTGIL